MQVMIKAVIPVSNPQKFHNAGVIKNVPNEISKQMVKICHKQRTENPIILAFPRAAICLSSYSNCFLSFLKSFTQINLMIKQIINTESSPAIKPNAKNGDVDSINILPKILKKVKSFNMEKYNIYKTKCQVY